MAKTRPQWTPRLASASLLALLVACGGGSTGDPVPVPASQPQALHGVPPADAPHKRGGFRKMKKEAGKEVPGKDGTPVPPNPNLRIGISFTGSTYLLDSPVIPPDTNGAVGRTHIVELLNGHYAAYDKSDGTRVASSSLDQFWSDAGVSARGFVVDPRVLFDASAQRWYASAVSINGGNGADDLLLAVSRQEDPTRGWVAFSVPFAGPVGNFADFPTLGFNRDGVFVFANGAVLVAPKADLLANEPTIARSSLVASTSLLTPAGTKAQAVVNLDDSPAALILGTWEVETSTLRRWQLTGDVTAPVLAPDEVFVALTPHATVGPEGARQPETDIGLFTGVPMGLDSSVVLQGGLMWGVQTVNFLGRAALRWFAIDATTNVRVQEGLISDPSHDVFMGSIAVNRCADVVIGFNRSGQDEFASAYAVAGTTSGGVTTFGDPILLRGGVARYDISGGEPAARWGDYSATVVDPQDPATFWTFQEWPSALNVWSTQVVQLQLNGGDGGPSCPAA